MHTLLLHNTSYLKSGSAHNPQMAATVRVGVKQALGLLLCCQPPVFHFLIDFVVTQKDLNHQSIENERETKPQAGVHNNNNNNEWLRRAFST